MEQASLSLTNTMERQLAKFGVVLCYVHGSVTRGTATRESDLDIAVLFERTPANPLRMIGDISEVLSALAPKRDLDIAILNETTPLFAQVIAVEGVVLYERSEDDRIRFEFRAMHEHEASKHVRRIGYVLLNARYAAL